MNKNLPFSFAKKHQLLLCLESDNYKIFCKVYPSVGVYSEICRHYQRHFEIDCIAETEFSARMAKTYQASSSASQEVMDEIDADFSKFDLEETMAEAEDLLEQEGEAPIVRLINAILAEAIQRQASDVHLETFEKSISIRFRVDGILVEVAQPKRSLAGVLVSRLKVMANLDIAEKRVPQDGRISLQLGGREVDVRVSTLPSIYGERVVLRLLDKHADKMDLSVLGLCLDDRQKLEKLLRLPHGIILVTGPTGSGKTTTLYAGLGTLNSREKNILTVEDPVEYHIQGLGQTQVNAKAGMSFSSGLRAILRQDPDVVMVGEIRDIETMQIAVQASLTGHLVLSTLHTNSAVGAVTRLLDMGLESFLLSSSLSGVLAQRLVRKLCQHCKVVHLISESEAAICGQDFGAAIPAFKASEIGCEYCSSTGYRGRTGIYELVVIEPGLRKLMHEGASEHEMMAQARKTTSSILDDGLRKVRCGETSLSEVLRVVQEI